MIKIFLHIGVMCTFLAGSLFASSAVPAQQDLQSRINAAAPGDTVMVLAGHYGGNIEIDKRIALIGVGRPVLRGNRVKSTITISADSCLLRGFVIEGSGPDLMTEDAGILVRSSHNTIEDNQLRDNLFGIYLFQSDFNTITGNTIIGREELDIGQRGSAIHVWDSHRNTLTGNIISAARDGFYIQYANHTLIAHNEVSSLRYGLHYMYADSNMFLHNRFYDNVAGAAIMYSKAIVFRHNVFAHNRGYSSYGILFQDCHNVIADSNVIADNVVGMFFEATTDNEFRHNVIARNDVALQMFQNSTDNTFTENNFIDNLSPLVLVGKRTGSRWSKNGRGNYWSMYGGYDLDGDGVGDVPMKIQNVFEYLEGQNANLRLYLYSPAAQALATAAQAFPIIAINSEEDPAPLMKSVDLHSLPAVRVMTALASPADRTRSAGGDGWLAFPVLGIVALGVVFRRLSRRVRR